MAKKHTVILTDTEVRAINVLLSLNACKSGCAFEECESLTGEDACDTCKFTKTMDGLAEKFEDLN